MLAYVLLLSALLGVQGTPNYCQTRTPQLYTNHALETEQNNLTCPCNETSGDNNQHGCNCFHVPKDKYNCNLTCFQDGINTYKKQFKKNTSLRKFVYHFHTRAAKCKDTNITCNDTCGELEEVSAYTFWERLKDAFQQIHVGNRVKNV